MKRLLTISLALLLSAGTLLAQRQQKVRNISSQEQNYETVAQPTQLSLRIENGKVWVNGNLIPKEQLPATLQNLHPNVFYQAAVFGVEDITFTLGAHEYLVRDGKVMEMDGRTPEKETKGEGNLAAKEAYYSQLKKEAPNLFYSLSREGALYEECRRLLLEYQMAQGKQKDKIREEIRLVLGQLFDINERNRELELQQLEQMIDAAKKEIEYRKRNKSQIIGNTLKDLLGE